MKTLIFLMLFARSDTTSIHFKAKDAYILASFAMNDEQTKIYNFLKASIIQNAEKGLFNVTITVDKKRFPEFYARKSDSKIWDDSIPVTNKLSYEGFTVVTSINHKSEMVYEIGWKLRK